MLFNNAGITIKPLSQGILGRAQIAHSLRRVKFNPSMTLSAENIGPGFGSLPVNNMEDIKLNFGEPVPRTEENKACHQWISVAAYYKAQDRGFVPGLELDDWLATGID